MSNLTDFISDYQVYSSFIPCLSEYRKVSSFSLFLSIFLITLCFSKILIYALFLTIDLNFRLSSFVYSVIIRFFLKSYFTYICSNILQSLLYFYFYLHFRKNRYLIHFFRINYISDYKVKFILCLSDFYKNLIYLSLYLLRFFTLCFTFLFSFTF